jgi:hypothetical protein
VTGIEAGMLPGGLGEGGGDQARGSAGKDTDSSADCICLGIGSSFIYAHKPPGGAPTGSYQLSGDVHQGACTYDYIVFDA